ncbi:pinensin family lanthipeptide [Longimicrobium sp.]|uniref:pinensin family lanthipeptide n=1 Tax=Longimicrobium sp. TaxID=2029185 RepID=UPI002C4FB0AE|nr:pinensin family lanthipeptide [Longimicrobium sp.]HSU12679.1 pinensin family lanthipeptide [Longimicrobium sp.]
MKKLRIEDLAVESFETANVAGGRGTVRAREVSYPDDSCDSYCASDYPRYSCGACESVPIMECNQTNYPYGCTGSLDYTFCEPGCDTQYDMGC